VILTIIICALSAAAAIYAFHIHGERAEALDFVRSLSLASLEATQSDKLGARECGRAEITRLASHALTSSNRHIRAATTRHLVEQLADHACAVAETLCDLTNDEGFEWMEQIHRMTRGDLIKVVASTRPVGEERSGETSEIFAASRQ
jgi:hypothetical protein